MNQIATIEKFSSPVNGLSNQQLSLIRNTVAKDTNADEFDMFMELCRNAGLDPFRKQIHCLVFNKDKPSKRQATFIVGIDGYRAIANRSGNYRPDDEEPRLIFDESLKDKTNPLGIEKAVVSVFKFSHGEWHKITCSAYWEEYVPLKEIWAENETGRKGPTGEYTIAKDNWVRMPKIMIAKCAEAQALRKGWPEDISGTYAAEEMDRLQAEMTATERVESFQREERLKLVGKDMLPVIFEMTEGIQMISEGEFADKFLDHANQLATSQLLEMFLEQNREGLRQFWAVQKGDALALKAELEKLRAKLKEAA
ncbi:phage recombination protein Bet [Curvivirga aplysinae]|uniref:phage recombination protein Bet n=1 Tax=Curvivirga aplysinae TaxID=2529852 RepID=UPI0012BC0D7E|nr:phage recombination protein Bet [Curvivirga aplysinae]MTI10514.1 phage recombination protein Bet [Curvivirga aplysinae]